MHRRHIILLLVVAVLTLGWPHRVGAQTAPAGELVYAMHVTIAPAWFDPAENGGLITPFIILYALHDGVVRPLGRDGSSRCLRHERGRECDGQERSAGECHAASGRCRG